MDRSESFENLICWQKAQESKKRLRKAVLPQLPTSERFDLHSQILTAARSSTATIAEGWGRFHYLDSNRFYYNSRGSLAELLDHVLEAKDQNYLSDELYMDLRIQILEAIKVLNGFIFYLKREYLKSLNKS
ncbi:MAG: four helix bundle protein [Algoriphagus sp.]|nr:four helix bundle protein [Algoriphagus sp.]